MYTKCFYMNATPMDNKLCSSCPLFLNTYVPFATAEGYSSGECDMFLCEGCPRDCPNKP